MKSRTLRSPTRRRRVSPHRWDKRLKRRLGYYEARKRLWRRTFKAFSRPTDVFLIGHTKSGNTWVAYMIAVLLSRDREEKVTLANVAEFVPFVHSRDHRVMKYRHLADPRIFRQEYPCYPALYQRVIYLVRDPRAALVSLWHMFLVAGDAPDTPIDSFLEQYMEHKGSFEWWNRDLERWDRQVAWWSERARWDEGVLVVRYEDLVRDRAGSVARIATFLDAGSNEADIELAVSRGDFRAMQELEDKHGAEAYIGFDPGKERFVRKGEIDGWRSELPPELAAAIEREFGPVMREFGYLP